MPIRTAEMSTLDQDCARCNKGGQPTAYMGGLGNWYIAWSTTRDADLIDESNWETACKELLPLGARIERFSHWACGWVDYLLVSPTCRKLGQSARRAATELRERYLQYPLLDESDYSQREYDESCRMFVDEAKWGAIKDADDEDGTLAALVEKNAGECQSRLSDAGAEYDTDGGWNFRDIDIWEVLTAAPPIEQDSERTPLLF